MKVVRVQMITIIFLDDETITHRNVAGFSGVSQCWRCLAGRSTFLLD